MLYTVTVTEWSSQLSRDRDNEILRTSQSPAKVLGCSESCSYLAKKTIHPQSAVTKFITGLEKEKTPRGFSLLLPKPRRGLDRNLM